MKKLLIPVSLLIFALATLFIFRFVLNGGEDTWICANNQWVKHGNPRNPAPYVKCGDVVNTTQKELKVLIAEAFSQKYQRSVNVFEIQVKTETPEFAQGLVNFKDEMGGGIWFAVKQDNTWKVVFDGNGIIGCDLADQYNLPKEIVTGCVNTTTGEFISR